MPRSTLDRELKPVNSVNPKSFLVVPSCRLGASDAKAVFAGGALLPSSAPARNNLFDLPSQTRKAESVFPQPQLAPNGHGLPPVPVSFSLTELLCDSLCRLALVEFAGIMENVPGRPALVLFTVPVSKSTLAISITEISAANIRALVKKSNIAFGIDQEED